jgi:Epoxide hydrolase N terminus
MTSTVETAIEIRPFHVEVPEEELTDLRRRIAATRWPEKETVTDESQGVPLAMTQELARYWATEYDWRRCEEKLNALPQFMTEIDDWTSTSSTFARSMRTRCRSSSTTGGPARSSSS